MGEAPQAQHLAAFLSQALRHLFENFPEVASFTDRPDPTEYAEYGTAAFAEAAGAKDEEIPPPKPLTPAPENQSARGGRPGRRRRSRARKPQRAPR